MIRFPVFSLRLARSYHPISIYRNIAQQTKSEILSAVCSNGPGTSSKSFKRFHTPSYYYLHHQRSYSKSILSSLPDTKSSTAATSQSGNSDKPDLRLAMRRLAYPVAILTVNLKDTAHGSTISSFNPIAMKPEPLISVSIQLPSRLADYLVASTQQSFTIHLLNHDPESIALAQLFSKPKDRFSPHVFRQLEHIAHTKLDCQVSNYFKLPLTSDPCQSDPSNAHGHSTLFIARVIQSSLASDSHQKPLLYHNRVYTTVNS